MDETYIRVGGTWRYLYRALTAGGNLRLLPLTKTEYGCGQAFPGQDAAIEYDSRVPRVINTEAPAWLKAISELKAEGICPQTVEHRQVKSLKNVL
ncbi:DDE-type integrase/transposase/recombinase [Corynebacterium tuberculostearicum]|uniref:DDE-type integrase/transposase/recombinase n=1 Tax=Corynebacterium tuberculostearicum TaxID=38304 RepID=UPI0038CF7BB5